jgi:hypothetical protein
MEPAAEDIEIFHGPTAYSTRGWPWTTILERGHTASLSKRMSPAPRINKFSRGPGPRVKAFYFDRKKTGQRLKFKSKASPNRLF